MSYDPSAHHRRSIRLKGYDYSQAGGYYATLCTQDKQGLFGEVVQDQVRLNEYGRIAHEEWWRTEKIRPAIRWDAWVVTPNHVHGTVWIGAGTVPGRGTAPSRGTARRAPTAERFGQPVSGSLSTLVRAYKSAVAKRINEIRRSPGQPVWQRGYYEHVVRNDADLERIREYIATNPLRWRSDPENPACGECPTDELW